MGETAIQIRADGTAEIYRGGRQYLRVFGDDGEPRWLKRTSRGLRPGSDHRARRLERIYRHPETVKQVVRSPRLPESQPVTQIEDFYDVPKIGHFRDQEVKWLVDSFLPEGCVVLFTGAPGSFKSFLSLYLGVSLSEETDFLGRKIYPAKVLYLDRDNPRKVVANRLKLFLPAEGDAFRIWGGWVGAAPPMIGDPRLLEIARKHKPVMIFDPLLRFHGAEENSATEMAGVMASLRQLANAGATVIVIHHSPKSEHIKYRGSTDIHASVDLAFWFTVDATTDPSTITIECFKNRFAEEFTITAQPDLAHRQFKLVPNLAAQKNISDMESLKKLIDAGPGLTQQELIERSGIGESRCRELLHAGTNNDWTVTRGHRKTMRYYPMGG